MLLIEPFGTNLLTPELFIVSKILKVSIFFLRQLLLYWLPQIVVRLLYKSINYFCVLLSNRVSWLLIAQEYLTPHLVSYLPQLPSP